MGHGTYSSDARTVRAVSLGYKTKSADDIFTQSKERRIHESMQPSKALLRESRDSESHPNSVPIIIALDTTGSMGSIPLYLVKEGLPKMVGNIIQKGVPDPQILFLGVGDHECDSAPLQVGQFESGDAELDLWLTRTWLEKGGGGNGGESYLLAWYFGAKHTVHDCFEKRGEKGILITIGDEPGLRSLPKRSVGEIMGSEPQGNFTDQQLLDLVKETYDVYHLHLTHHGPDSRSEGYWKNILGQHCILVDNYEDVSDVISSLVVSNVQSRVSYNPSKKTNVIVDSTDSTNSSSVKPEEIIL
jgi:hypothetical protein